MITATLLSGLGGTLLGMFTEVFKLIRDKSDKVHELAIMQLQMKLMELGHALRLEEINAQADIAETQTIYKTFKTGIEWVDALNGTVRPVIAYSFFSLYAYVKIMALRHIDLTAPVFLIKEALWTIDDMVIFSGILGFYFGNRIISKGKR